MYDILNILYYAELVASNQETEPQYLLNALRVICKKNS
jgi:hypothetical protein